MKTWDLLHISMSVLLAGCLLTCSAEEEEIKDISAEPELLKQAIGREAKFECKTTLTNVTLVWLNPNGTNIKDVNDSRISVNGGELKIVDVVYFDAGEYGCFTTDRRHNATVLLEIYEMPSYMLEGMIILIINGVLLVIFFLCLVHSAYQRKKMERKMGYKDANQDPNL